VWCFGRVAATGLPIGSRRFARACEKLPADTLIDGEVIVVGENGGCAFKRFAAQASKGSYPTLCLRYTCAWRNGAPLTDRGTAPVTY
jgi:hypothetical protein